jgi:plastocyanin
MFGRVTVTAAVALSMLVAGCGSGGGSSSGSGGGSGQTLKLAADPGGKLAFNQDKLSAKPGKVTIHLDNPKSSGKTHGIGVNGNGVDKDGPSVPAGKGSSVTVDLKPGTYTFYCPVPGHEQAGMKGTLTVAGGSASGSSGSSGGSGSGGGGGSGGGY